MVLCKSKDNTLFDFDPRSFIENKISLSEIADDINYIPLDNSCPLGFIHDNIEFINNSFYLSENKLGILVFDINGNLIRKIGSKGRGPGEYSYTFDFTIDKETETIYVWDNNIIKVFSKNGNFLRSFSLKEYGGFIHPIKFLNSTLFAFFSVQFENVENKWIAVDSLGNLIKKEKRKTPSFTREFSVGEGAYVFQNNITFWNSIDDTVFSILPDLTETPSYFISPGEHRYPKSRKNVLLDDMTKYLSIPQILETKHLLMIRYFYNDNKYILLYDKEKRIIYKVDWDFNGTSGIINDLDGGPGFIPKIYFKKNGAEFIGGLINPIQIKNLVSSVEFRNFTPQYSNKKKELEKLANSIKETDNPILVIIKLKE